MTLKQWLKRQIASSGMLRLASRLLPAGAVILRYHSVQEDPNQVADTIGTGISHSAEMFTRQMEYVARHYQPVSLDDILVALSSGSPLPTRSVAITFDDGFRDNGEVALPILNRVGVPATFYVTAGAVEEPFAPWYIRLRKAFYNSAVPQWTEPTGDMTIPLDSQDNREAALVAACGYCARLAGGDQHKAVRAIEEALEVEAFKPERSLMLSWSQIRTIHEQGHVIGSHTISHPNMAYVSRKDLFDELKGSKALLEDKVGTEVCHFSYPSPMLEPHWTPMTVGACQQVGYKTATTCTSGNVKAGDNPLALQRMWVPFEMPEFVWYLDNTLVGRGL